ncbi:MAG: response regulator transcription factor [Bacteroidota bacterium]
MIRVAIVDDEPLAQEILQSYLQKLPDTELVGVCKNALEAFALVNKQAVDLLLLDINMPEITGIDFLKSLKNPPKVIFTTAYTEHALESYDLNAVDYLIKPIAFDRFLKAINKVQNEIQPARPQTSVTPSEKILFVRSEGKWININIRKLWFVEGLKDYVRLWTDDGRITVHSTMKNFEEQLKPYSNFVRVHKSHIINLEYITEVDGNSIQIKDQLIAIGSTYKDDVQKLLDGYRLL